MVDDRAKITLELKTFQATVLFDNSWLTRIVYIESVRLVKGSEGSGSY